MTRNFTLCPIVAAVCVAMCASPAGAQGVSRAQSQIGTMRVASLSQADLHGTVLDQHQEPLVGAVVSAIGEASAFAVSDSRGRFTFRNLPFGPYLVRVYLQGYLPAQARLIQVDRVTQDLASIALVRRADETQPAPVLAAGVGVSVPAPVTREPDPEDLSDVPWRVRHLKRPILKEASTDGLDFGGTDALAGSDRATFGDVTGPARLAAALFADLSFTGQVNLLTTTSFDHPQDLFSADTSAPRGIAFISLEAPTTAGRWSMRGAITQGDLASWIIAGSYLQTAPGAHQIESGLSYGMQRYMGGSATTLAAVADGARNVGTVYAYDSWTINPRISVGYGANYSRYNYLPEQTLLSPRASVTLTPTDNERMKVRASVSRRVVAPGAEEFVPPSSGLWLPPERTFSPLSARQGFNPEYIDHLEISAERDWVGDFSIGVRAFRQDVDDQIVTLFGMTLPDAAPAKLGHYYVASGGSVEARGWGITVSRRMAEGLRASIDYTRVTSTWTDGSADSALLAWLSPSASRHGEEQLHDLTTSIDGVLPVTETRVFVVYKVNTGFADASSESRPGVRFDVQLNQALPFLDFTNARFEMLVGVRNLFRDELVDASVYDELLVVRPPKRIVGGVTVRF